MKDRLWTAPYCQFILLVVGLLAVDQANAQIRDLEATYQFLVSDRKVDGILYKATAGALNGAMLPLSFYDTPQYWGAYVCKEPGTQCAVTDSYNPADYTLTPRRSPAGDLQTERVNVHNGTNIYDAATWQIAVVLGQVVNRFGNLEKIDAYTLATNQNRLLTEGYSGNAATALRDANRAMTKGNRFLYNSHVINNSQQAYKFRMISRNWLATDPFIGTAYESLISVNALPKNDAAYKLGKVTWTDWKPITGENAWAFLLGPLHAAYLHYVKSGNGKFVPFDDLAVQNAVALLPTFAAMQAQIGGVYHVPSGTLSNQGDQLTSPYQVSVENNASLYAGLRVLEATLKSELKYEKTLGKADVDKIDAALATINSMINGGQVANNKATAGLLAFFRNDAWRNNEFVQGGLANDPNERSAWIPTLNPKAVDTNTWGIAALGAKQIDQWFGFGAAYKNWQQVKQWGGYGVNDKLWGVGYSDEDGNGMNRDGTYRSGVLSTEWTAGAINMIRNLIAHYESIAATASNRAAAQSYVRRLKEDESAMLAAIQTLRVDHYNQTSFPGKPNNYGGLAIQSSKSYLYASKRYFIPFGWYANPLPSTCATAWIVMLADRFDPFGYAGQPN